MLTTGLKTTFCKNSTEVKLCSMNFPIAKSPPRECLVSHLSTRTRECVYTLAHTHVSQLLSAEIKGGKKDLFLSKLSQSPHLPVWVNLTRMISFVFSLLYVFFFPSQTQKFCEKCFLRVLADKYTHAVHSQGASGTIANSRDRS